ncbi:MAG: XRE family transcriptional regulator [Candidatus Nanopelagicales bacterium]
MSTDLREVGAKLRAQRNARGWTLDELASRANMSASTLSRLESGKRQASLELLIPLTRQLGIRIDDLLPAEQADPRIRRPVLRRGGHVMVPLTAENAPIHAYKITCPVLTSAPVQKTHDGYEWLFVLTGRLRLSLGENEFTLKRGEAAEFDTRTPHAMWALGNRQAEVLSIFNDSGEKLHTRTNE